MMNLKNVFKLDFLLKTVKIVFFIILALVIGGYFFFWNSQKILGNEMPMPSGYGAAIVLSGSMEPELSIDDLVIVKEKDDYHVGDVVVYQDGSSLVVHRIVSLNNNHIVTKGDANNVNDNPILMDEIKGEVIYVLSGAGKVFNFIRNPLVIIIFAILSIVLFGYSYKVDNREMDEEIESLKKELEKLKNS